MYFKKMQRSLAEKDPPQGVRAFFKQGLVHNEDIMGMTNEQYKGLLLDTLEEWEEALELAREAGAERVIRKAEQQIAKINEKLKF